MPTAADLNRSIEDESFRAPLSGRRSTGCSFSGDAHTAHKRSSRSKGSYPRAKKNGSRSRSPGKSPAMLEPLSEQKRRERKTTSKKSSKRKKLYSKRQTDHVRSSESHKGQEGEGSSIDSRTVSTADITADHEPGLPSFRLNEAEALIVQLNEQLVFLKEQNCNLQKDAQTTMELLEEERADMREIEEENLDMQHDLAETRRIRDRLERENRVLSKKLTKRDSENHRLQAKVDNLTGVTGDESNVGRFEYEQVQDHHSPNMRRGGLQRHEQSRQSMWSLLAEETISDQTIEEEPGTRTPTGSKTGVFDSFFRKSGSSPLFTGSVSRSLSSLADMSALSSSSSHSRRQKSPLPLGSPRGGFVPAA